MIREEFKNNHFSKMSADSKQALNANDEAIYGILMKVLGKWRAEKMAEQDMDHEEWKETVVLSSGERMPRGPSDSLKDKGDEMPETVILSPAGKAEGYAGPIKKSDSEDLLSLDETVSLQDKKRVALPKKDINKSGDQNILTETVILKPKKDK